MSRLAIFKFVSIAVVSIVVLFSLSTVAIFLGTDGARNVEPNWVIVIQNILVATRGNFATIGVSVLEALPVLLSVAIFKKEQPDVEDTAPTKKLTQFELAILTILLIGTVSSIVALFMFDASSDEGMGLESGPEGVMRIIEVNQIVLRQCLMMSCLVLGLKKLNI